MTASLALALYRLARYVRLLSVRLHCLALGADHAATLLRRLPKR